MIECEFIGSNRVIEKFTGKVRMDDFIFLKEDEFAHENYHIGINFFVDLREAEMIFAKITDLQKINDFLKIQGFKMNNSNIAVLVNPDLVGFFKRTVKDINGAGNRIRIKIFMKETEADRWLKKYE